MGGERDYVTVDANEIMRELRQVAVDIATIKADTHTMSRVVDQQVTGLTDVTNRQTKQEGRMDKQDARIERMEKDCVALSHIGNQDARIERIEKDYATLADDSKQKAKEMRTTWLALIAIGMTILNQLSQWFHWGAVK